MTPEPTAVPSGAAAGSPNSSLPTRLADARVGAFPLYVGDAAGRGRAMMEDHREHFPRLLAFQDSIGPALQSAATRRWLDSSLGLLADRYPAAIEFVRAAAEVAGVRPEVLLAEPFRKFLEQEPDQVSGSAAADSAAAVSQAADEELADECSVGAGVLRFGAWVVKNRDNGIGVGARHIVTQHRDPSWGGRTVLSQSTIGGPLATSAGINSSGLCIVSTAGPAPAGVGPGILRSYLLGELLGHCVSVDEALEVIASVQHLGGTFTLGDSSGAIASVDLHPDEILIERPDAKTWLARTNHYTHPPHANAHPDGPPENSVDRLATMCAVMPALAEPSPSWSERELAIAGRMTEHGTGTVCRHEDKVSTIATSIFTTCPPSMLTSVGAGCTGEWERWTAG